MHAPAVLPWQQDIWRHLAERRRSGRLPHALLFVGPPGVGKVALAHCFAQSLLCEQPTDTGLACAACTACRRFLSDAHPDFLWVRSDIGTGGDVKAAVREESEGDASDAELGAEKGAEKGKASRYIRVDQIRALTRWFEFTSHCGGHKVALLAPADQMNTNAANGLLKTLEDPPAGALLMLVATHPTRLLATIRSRCQVVTFPTVTPEFAIPWLHTQGIGDPSTAQLLLTLAGGGPLAALDSAHNQLLALRATIFAELEGVVLGRVAPITVAQAWLARGLDMILAFQWSVATDMIRILLTPDAKLTNPDLAARLAMLAQRLGVRRLYARLDHLNEALRLVRGATNPNVQLLLEDLLILWRA